MVDPSKDQSYACGVVLVWPIWVSVQCAYYT
jgi:hypothetical protein